VFAGVLTASASVRAQATYEPYDFVTLAGNAGSLGTSDGPGYLARFNAPQAVAIGSDGSVFVADTGNNTIRKVSPAGVVTTLAGSAGVFGSSDGTGSAASFALPQGVAVDNAGTIYVGDSANHTIRKVTPAGVVTTFAGLAGSRGSSDGAGSSARFFNPIGVATDSSGNVYVADNGNVTIRKITPAGVVSTLAGVIGNAGSDDGTGSGARFAFPSGIATDSTGNIFVADTSNHTIRKITSAGVVTTIAGSVGAVGSADGTGSAARFDGPRGVATDGVGMLYVADTGNSTIRKITPAGAVTTLAGLASNTGSANGTGSNARFNIPYSIAASSAGRVCLADTLSHTIRRGARQATLLANISTRVLVQPGDNVLIGGFIITGTQPKKVIVRARGPSLPLAGVLANPTLDLYGPNGLIASNDNWQDAPNAQETITSNFAPTNSLESAIVASLPANNSSYTAIVGGGTGVGLFEVYDLDGTADAKLANVSSRGFVLTGDDAMIAGFVITGPSAQKVIVRAIGPSLSVTGKLADPSLQLFDLNGNSLGFNDNWRTDQEAEIVASSIAPSNDLESAIVRTLPPGVYTAIVSGAGGTTGVALVEVYALQ
jgi:sugar lactone lactonase YvrE